MCVQVSSSCDFSCKAALNTVDPESAIGKMLTEQQCTVYRMAAKVATATATFTCLLLL